jgi:hypothetical protein
MRRFRSLVLVACLVSGVVGSRAARPDDGAPAAPSPLLTKENAARTKAAEELAGLAKFCVMYSAYDDARQTYAKAIAIAPAAGGDALKAEAEKLKGKSGTTPAGVAAQIADRRTKCLAKCAEILAPAAAAYAQADSAADLARVIALMKAQGLPAEAPLAKADVVLFEPYYEWHTRKDAEKLGKGWEMEGGAWIEPVKVAELNLAHATWATPWIVADDVHEVRTTLPLRSAKQVLARVASFRRFFLGYFAGEWDLKAPDVKLPIVLTQTQADLDKRMHEVFPDLPATALGRPASYLTSTKAGNPCFASLEATVPGGGTVKFDLAALQWALQREIALQLAYEYSKHGADRTRLSRTQAWAMEGLPEFMSYFAFVDGSWVLTHPKEVTMSGATFEGAFAYCQKNVGRIPPLGQYVALAKDKFRTVENFQIAATLAWYLLEGDDRAYRPHFVKVLQTIYQCRDETDTFNKCFEGVHDLDAGFRAFCKAIKLDGR